MKNVDLCFRNAFYDEICGSQLSDFLRKSWPNSREETGDNRRRSGESNTADFHVSSGHVGEPEKPEKTPRHFAVITPKQFLCCGLFD